MAKFEAIVDIGFSNAERRVSFQIDDNILEDLNDEEYEDYVQNEAETAINKNGIITIRWEPK